MRTSGALVDKRRKEIVDYLVSAGQQRITTLADHFHVSALTIRRDLNELEAQGLVRRSYGIVELIDPLGSPISSREVVAKRSIAQATAQLIEDGDTIFVNTSSTALAVLEYITAHNVTVITNNGRTLQLDLPSTLSVILTGGEIRLPKWSMAGEFALASIQRVRATKAVLGCSGLSLERGMTTLVSHETSVNARMLEQSDQHIIVADNTKMGRNSSFCYGDLTQVDVLVTDDGTDRALLQSFKDAGVKKIIQVGNSVPMGERQR
jgi:DeoR/GlpR family transcriptional regulator of sugar metabolism